MNKLYLQIFDTLNCEHEDNVELLDCFTRDYTNVSKEIIDKVDQLLNKLIIDENDKYAPYYLYLLKKHTTELNGDETHMHLKRSASTGFFRAVIFYFQYLLEKYDYLACKYGSEEDIVYTYNETISLLVKNKDRFLASKQDNDEYYQIEDYAFYIDGVIDLLNGYQIYLDTLNSKDMTLDLAERFAKSTKWFKPFSYSHPKVRELYVKTLNWLVSQNKYDYLVELIYFQDDCQPEYEFGILNYKACSNTLKFLADGVLALSVECSQKFIEVFDKLNKERPNMLTDRDKRLYKLSKQTIK